MSQRKPVPWLSRLVSLVPPPDTPAGVGSPRVRRDIEHTLGITLPDDLFEFISVYGSGEFRTNDYPLVLSIYSPFSPFFVRKAKSMKKDFCNFWPGYDAYPDSPGLFPCGTGNGPRDLFFYTEGPSNRWPLVTNLSPARLVRMALSLPEYPFRLFDASLEGEPGKVDNPWFKECKGQFYFQP